MFPRAANRTGLSRFERGAQLERIVGGGGVREFAQTRRVRLLQHLILTARPQCGESKRHLFGLLLEARNVLICVPRLLPRGVMLAHDARHILQRVQRARDIVEPLLRLRRAQRLARRFAVARLPHDFRERSAIRLVVPIESGARLLRARQILLRLT